MVNRELSRQIITKFGRDMIILKALEEMAELSEVLLKTITKQPHLKPPVEKIHEELGDVEVRLGALKEMVGWVEVDTRVVEKEGQIERYISRIPSAE